MHVLSNPSQARCTRYTNKTGWVCRGGGVWVGVGVGGGGRVCVCADILIFFATSNLIYSINTHTKTRQLPHLINIFINNIVSQGPGSSMS